MNRHTVIGLTLVTAGILFLVAGQIGAGDAVTILLIGAAFLVAYTYTKSYGTLIPGAVLAGLGACQLLDARFFRPEWDATLLGLAIGFLAAYLLDIWFHGSRPGGWWPLVPAGLLGVLGLGFNLDMLSRLQGYQQWWPVLLVIAGIWVLTARRRRAEA